MFAPTEAFVAFDRGWRADEKEASLAVFDTEQYFRTTAGTVDCIKKCNLSLMMRFVPLYIPVGFIQ